jgi:hypothetical protein
VQASSPAFTAQVTPDSAGDRWGHSGYCVHIRTLCVAKEGTGYTPEAAEAELRRKEEKEFGQKGLSTHVIYVKTERR